MIKRDFISFSIFADKFFSDDLHLEPCCQYAFYRMKQFLPGDLVSYFSGKKKLEDELFFDNMTAEEEEDAESYSFGLAENSPAWWGVPKGQVAETDVAE